MRNLQLKPPHGYTLLWWRQPRSVVWYEANSELNRKVTHDYLKKKRKVWSVGVDDAFVNPFEIVSVCGPKLLSRDLGQMFPLLSSSFHF